MEIVLEIEGPSGSRTWHRLSESPLTIGRSLTSDVILDDPYADGHHARITQDESGALVIEDLGSVNGIRIGGVRGAGRVPVTIGSELWLGRTVVRFRDRHEVMARAFVDDEHAAPPQGNPPLNQQSPAPPPAGAPLFSGWRALLFAAGAVAAYSVYAWLGSTERSSGGDIFGVATVLALCGAVWAGAWAVASRVSVHRFNFSGHLAVISAASIGGLIVVSFGVCLS